MNDDERLMTMLPLSRIPGQQDSSYPEGDAVSSIVRKSQELGGLLPMIVEVVPAPILIIDERHRVVIANGAARTLLSEEETKFLGYSVGRFLSLEKLVSARVTLLSRAGSFTYEDAVFVGGIERAIEVRLELLESAGTEYLCATLLDLTDTVRERAEWVDSKRPSAPPSTRMEHARRLEALGQLTGSLAHDFNNLLAVILGSLSNAERRTSLGQDAREDLARARTATERSIEATSQILRYARNRPPEVDAVNPLDLLNELRGLVERALGDVVRVVFDLRPTPPIVVGAAQLETALLNLMINARDATSEGGEVTVRLSTRFIDEDSSAKLGLTSGTHVSLAVIDSGVGMSEEVQERVFEPFYTTKPAGQGTGLGLSTVRSVAQKFGGAVHLNSAIDRGTTVELLFPALVGSLD